MRQRGGHVLMFPYTLLTSKTHLQIRFSKSAVVVFVSSIFLFEQIVDMHASPVLQPALLLTEICVGHHPDPSEPPDAHAQSENA